MELYMIVIGGKPDGRNTEQHDVFFGIGKSLSDLVPDMYAFWPALESRMHIDSYRRVSQVDRYSVRVVIRSKKQIEQTNNLYFVNLGGYKPNDMEEYHYKQLVVATNLADATRIAKESVFWKHHESSHIDDKYGIDVDDIYEVNDLLPKRFRDKYGIVLEEKLEGIPDVLEIGYLKMSKLITSKGE